MNINLQITVSVTGFVVRCLARHIYEAFPQSIFTRHIQHNICIEDSKAIRLLICTKMNDQYKQTWHSSIPAHIRFSNYVLFKDNRTLEPYLYKLSTSNRIYLSKFRCRSNYMPVSKAYKHADTYDTKVKSVIKMK